MIKTKIEKSADEKRILLRELDFYDIKAQEKSSKRKIMC